MASKAKRAAAMRLRSKRILPNRVMRCYLARARFEPTLHERRKLPSNCDRSVTQSQDNSCWKIKLLGKEGRKDVLCRLSEKGVRPPKITGSGLFSLSPFLGWQESRKHVSPNFDTRAGRLEYTIRLGKVAPPIR